MNYFELFNLPVQLKTNRQQLTEKYFALQKKYHPDFYTQADEDEKNEALEMSSQVNKGFKTLQDPMRTIAYVLQQKGLLEEEEKYKLSPDFLMEMMELNEELPEMKEDIARNKIAAMEADLYSEVSTIVETYKDGETSNDNLLKVKDYYFKKKYLQRILERLDD